MTFKINALDHQEFESHFTKSDSELEKLGIQRMIVDVKPGYPCRVSLQDAEIGEEVILLPYEYHKTSNPYQAKGPIFIRKGSKTRVFEKNVIPVMLNHRLLSFRAYDENGNMVDAKTEQGINTKKVIERFFGDSDIQYIHIHNSSPGCYNCEVRRID